MQNLCSGSSGRRLGLGRLGLCRRQGGRDAFHCVPKSAHANGKDPCSKFPIPRDTARRSVLGGDDAFHCVPNCVLADHQDTVDCLPGNPLPKARLTPRLMSFVFPRTSALALLTLAFSLALVTGCSP